MIRHISRVVVSLIAAIPDIAIALVFIVTWFAPLTFGEYMVRHLMLVMLLEFIVIHSAAFMGQLAIAQSGVGRKILVILGFGVFYSIFAGAFSLAFSSLWPLMAFWGLTLNRLLRVILGGAFSAEEKELMTREWATTTMLYLLFIFMTTLLPMPRFGITPAIVAAQEIPGSGAWVAQPQRVIAFGALYFSSLAFMSLATVRWLPQREESRRVRGGFAGAV